MTSSADGASNAGPEKIAILGGGMGGIAVAWALTELPDHADRFDITLYQMGWRLGGKGASGRNAAAHDRIEEHGLHVWLGFYDNAFKAMKKAYAELGREPGTPLATWQDAYKKHSIVVLMERVGTSWKPWTFDFPENDLEPGVPTDDPFPTAWGYAKKVLAWVLDHYKKELHAPRVQGEHDLAERSWLERAFAGVEREFSHVVQRVEELGLAGGAAALMAATELAHAMPHAPEKHDEAHHGVIARLLEEFMHWLEREFAHLLDENDDLRRAWLIVSMGVAMVRGMIADDVILRGFKAVTQYDFREWLARHGASERVTSCPLIWGLYDLVFGFVGGDPKRPDFNAGMALRSVFSMLFEYKGAIFWEMQAGMGDTVFVPFYEVLKRRGVKFEFFHKVENLGVAEGEKRIQTVRMQRQVWLRGQRPARAGAGAATVEYSPLSPVRDLPCWPSEPLLDQIDPEQAEEIRRRGINLESYYADWKGAETRTLELGRDFDRVVLAIPPGAHPFICQELIRRDERFATMVEKVQTVQTQAMQLWLYPTLAELGWQGEKPVLDAYEDSLNTWSDMSHLIVRESWPEEGGPQNIAYFCGPRLDAEDAPSVAEILAGKASWFPMREDDRQESEAIAWLDEYTGGLWPRATASNDRRALDMNHLVAPPTLQGAERAGVQYFRANYEPSERYVLSVKGSDRYRLRPDDSGFDNLILAGDWCDNGFLNAGAIEPTTISGLLAARAIAGGGIDIAWLPPEE